MESDPQNRTWALQKRHFCWKSFLAYQGIPGWIATYCSPELKSSVPSPPPATLGIFSPNLRVTLDESFIPVWKENILRIASSIIFFSFTGKLFRSLASILYCNGQCRYIGILKEKPLRLFTITTAWFFWTLTTSWYHSPLSGNWKGGFGTHCRRNHTGATWTSRKGKLLLAPVKYQEIKLRWQGTATSFCFLFCPRKRNS